MTRSVYVIGGAGTGKSTFMSQLMDRVVMQYAPLEELHAKPNKKAVVTLRGHRLNDYDGRDGLYLGFLRDSFPGTDGLDRASSPTGEEWLDLGMHKEFDFLLAEGATLATRRFVSALHRHTDLLLVHLYAEEFVKDLRFLERGSNQDPKFVLATATRSENLLADMRKLGVDDTTIDSSYPARWVEGLDIAQQHLQG